MHKPTVCKVLKRFQCGKYIVLTENIESLGNYRLSTHPVLTLTYFFQVMPCAILMSSKQCVEFLWWHERISIIDIRLDKNGQLHQKIKMSRR